MVITKIQAATDVKIITRLAAYIRVSSDSEDQLHSFSAQYRYYNSIAANSDDTILIDIYADEGITGTCTDKRDEFNRMMNDARKHKFDRIIVKSVTRFARNTKDCLEAVRELKQLGISVYFEENNIDTNKTEGETLITLLGMAAQNESLSISKNMRWSIQKRMQNGTYINCAAPFGYKYENHKLVIIPEEAEIVKNIFHSYLNGIGIKDIAVTLTEKTGNVWYAPTVRYILSNERYIGDSVYQKRYTTDGLPFARKRNRGEMPQYYIQNTHEPIIDADTFEAVQRLKSSTEYKYTTGNEYLFTKKIKCNSCGHTFKRIIVRKYIYWTCDNHNENAKNCPIKPISETAIHGAYISMFNKLKRFGHEIISPALGQLEDLIMKKQCGNKQILSARGELIAAREKMNQITRLHSSGILSDDIYNAQKKEIEAKIMRLKELMTAACDTDDIVNTLDKLSDLMDILNERDIMTEFDETVFGITVEKMNQITRLHSSGILSDDIYNAQKKEIEAKIMRLKDLMTAACDTDSIVSTLDKLSDLMDILNEHEVMTEFDEAVFGLTVEKMTAFSETEIVFRLIGGVEFTEIIERR